MILLKYLINSLLFYANAIYIDSHQNEIQKSLDFDIPNLVYGPHRNYASKYFHEVLWIRTRTLTLDLCGKHADGNFDDDVIRVHATIPEGQQVDEARIMELEQKLQEALRKMDELKNPPKRKGWFGCCKKRKRRDSSSSTLPPLPIRQSTRPSSVVVHVHTPPPKISSSITNTNTFSPSPTKIADTISSNLLSKNEMSSTKNESPLPPPPPPSNANSDSSTSKLVPETESSAPGTEASCSESTAPNTQPAEQEGEKMESTTDKDKVTDDLEEKLVTIPEQTSVPTSEEKSPNIHEDLEGNNFFAEEEKPLTSTETSLTSKNDEQTPLVTVIADIHPGKMKKTPQKESHPIYTAPRKKKSTPAASKKVLNFRYTTTTEKEKSYPIYTGVRRSNVKPASTPKKEDDLVRKVQLSKKKNIESASEKVGEPDDLIRKVHLTERKKQSSSVSSTEVQNWSLVKPESLSRKQPNRQVVVLANLWPEISNEKDLSWENSRRRPGQFQLEYDSRYAARETRAKKSPSPWRLYKCEHTATKYGKKKKSKEAKPKCKRNLRILFRK